jgi:hypothetical protein
MTALKIRCTDPVQAHKAITGEVWPLVKANLMAGNRMMIEVKPETRSQQENALLHALITQIASQKQWAGSSLDVDTWKRLLVAAWLRARGESAQVYPALDGRGIDVVYQKTSTLTRAQCAELIDYVQAWAAQNDVKLLSRE